MQQRRNHVQFSVQEPSPRQIACASPSQRADTNIGVSPWTKRFCSRGYPLPPGVQRNGEHEIPMIFVVAPNGRRIPPPKPKRRLIGTQCRDRRSPPEKSTCPADFNSAPHPEESTSLPTLHIGSRSSRPGANRSHHTGRERMSGEHLIALCG